MIKKILILGPIASGKSSLSVHLGKYLGLPVYHLDILFWESNWKVPNVEKWEKKKKWLLEKECWIIDGNYLNSLSDRLSLADLVIYLDCPTYICVVRTLRRFYSKNRNKYLAKGCENKFSIGFLKKTILFNTLHREQILKIIKNHPNCYIFSYADSSVDNIINTIFNNKEDKHEDIS